MLAVQGSKIGTLCGVYDEEGSVNIRDRFLIDPDGASIRQRMPIPKVRRDVFIPGHLLRSQLYWGKSTGPDSADRSASQHRVTLKDAPFFICLQVHPWKQSVDRVLSEPVASARNYRICLYSLHASRTQCGDQGA